jgi:ABC-type nickel/cobalt efflux system permease component RcnA
MPGDVDQQARDHALKAQHMAELSAQAISQHMDACEKNHAEDAKRFDKLSDGLSRIHGRIDALVRGGLYAAFGALFAIAVSVVGFLATKVIGG